MRQNIAGWCQKKFCFLKFVDSFQNLFFFSKVSNEWKIIEKKFSTWFRELTNFAYYNLFSQSEQEAHSYVTIMCHIDELS